MTGFTNWLRWAFHIPKSDSIWVSSSRKHLLVPVRIKVHVRNKRQIEYKVEYLVQPGLKEQIYDLRLFLFFPAELDAASTSFFASLFESVRLHTPTVDPSELTEPDGPALRGIREALTELKSKMARDADVGPAQKRVVYQLQLLGCTFRRALRKRGKRIIVALSSGSEGLPSAEDERAAAAGICDLLETADAAMRAIQKVCSGCLADGSPRWQQEAWRLVEEQMLLEARITLLKLAARLDDIYAEEDFWPAMSESLAPRAPVEGSCLDRQQVQRLREQTARSVSSAHSAEMCEGAGKITAAAASSAGQSIINSAFADDNSARTVGGHDTGALNPVKQKPRASGNSSAAAYNNTGATGVAGLGAGQRAGTQEAEWQLTSLSRKALSSGRTKSSSLEWIYPGTLMRRLSIMGRGCEQPALQSRAVHAEDSHAAADSGPPCVNEEPDLELGLLPEHNADSTSALLTNEAGQSTLHASSGRRPGADQRSHAARELLSRARVLALQQTERLEALSEQKGYSESLLDEGADLENEHYTDRCMQPPHLSGHLTGAHTHLTIIERRQFCAQHHWRMFG
ncbi:hypothetical protein CVIRNUC_008057 [Coccomyxa viridis]|uniref:Uncharacterized protein n=1 Tax=Coccomyxa viridis TaxID=1274662 RepID=A0AAV1IDR4_9CHLO|nr:hypothetical protein CVIRNUC_008057 [Coccomyxa viridis]